MDILEQATYEILLVDPQNPGYEDLPYEVADEATEDEFEESDDPDDGSDDEWTLSYVTLLFVVFIILFKYELIVTWIYEILICCLSFSLFC